MWPWLRCINESSFWKCGSHLRALSTWNSELWELWKSSPKYLCCQRQPCFLQSNTVCVFMPLLSSFGLGLPGFLMCDLSISIQLQLRCMPKMISPSYSPWLSKWADQSGGLLLSLLILGSFSPRCFLLYIQLPMLGSLYWSSYIVSHQDVLESSVNCLFLLPPKNKCWKWHYSDPSIICWPCVARSILSPWISFGNAEQSTNQISKGLQRLQCDKVETLYIIGWQSTQRKKINN